MRCEVHKIGGAKKSWKLQAKRALEGASEEVKNAVAVFNKVQTVLL